MGEQATRVHVGPRGAGKDVSGAVPSAIDNDTDLVTLSSCLNVCSALNR